MHCDVATAVPARPIAGVTMRAPLWVRRGGRWRGLLRLAAVLLFVPWPSLAQGTSAPAGARAGVVRAATPANWKCRPTSALERTHHADALFCNARFVASSIRVAAVLGALAGASRDCAFRVAAGVERGAAYALTGDTAGARVAEATACDGRVVTRDSLAYAPDVLLQACPGVVWSWTDRGAAQCRASGGGPPAAVAALGGTPSVTPRAAAAAPAPPSAAPAAAMAPLDPEQSRTRTAAFAELRTANRLYAERAYAEAERVAAEVARQATANPARFGRDGGDVAGYALATAGAAKGRQGRYDDAVAMLRRAVALAPMNGWADTQLAIVLSILGRDAEAADAARAAVALDPTSAEAHRTLGSALNRLGHPTEGLAELDVATELAPRDPVAALERARALNAAKRFGEAAVAARAALGLRPDDAFVYEELGVALAGGGDRAGAIAAFRRALALEPAAHAAREQLDSLTRAAAP